jgi:hypothetical protein
MRGPARPALGAFGVYVALSLGSSRDFGLDLGVGGGVPFVRFPAFQFPLATGPTAVPFFRADGVEGPVERWTDFQGIDPAAIDLRHEGYACSVEHQLHEQQHWIREHLAPAWAPPGSARVELGLRIVALDADGRVATTLRVDAAGTASRR